MGLSFFRSFDPLFCHLFVGLCSCGIHSSDYVQASGLDDRKLSGSSFFSLPHLFHDDVIPLRSIMAALATLTKQITMTN